MNNQEALKCKKIGENIREIRKSRNISQLALAQKSGLSMSQISDIENGKVSMKITSLIAICEAMDVSADYMLSEVNASEHQIYKEGVEIEWYVIRYNINSRKIEKYNIFNHGSLVTEIRKLVKKHWEKEVFAEALKHNLMYYFWCKSEWEIIVSPWLGRDAGSEDEKIDVYWQVINNWSVFLDYVWENRKSFLR